MSGGTQHEHIAEVQWRNPKSGAIGRWSRQQMVQFIDNNGDEVRVADGQGSVPVRVVEAKPRYIRTRADGRWTDNLLALPRY